MTRLLAAGVAALLCVAVGLAAEEPAVVIQGEWRVVSGESDGEPLPAERLEDATALMRFTEGKLVIQAKDNKLEGEYTLDATKSPMELSLAPTGEKAADLIFRFEDDVLVLCGPVKAGGPRPTEFTSNKGSKQAVMKFKRIAK